MTRRAFQALILAALGLFLLNRILSGTLFWYINQRFLPLTLFAALGCLILAQAVFPRRRSTLHDQGPHDHVHEHEPAHLPVWQLLLVALPVVLGVLVPARPLGSSALANKGFNASGLLAAGAAAEPAQLERAPEARSVLDWVRLFNYESDPSVFAGQPADVIGFVYHDPRLAQGQFLVGRFSVTCCVADAMAIGMLVEWPAGAELADNSWVRVRGPVQAGALNGRPAPMIQAQSVTLVPPPEHPYLYP